MFRDPLHGFFLSRFRMPASQQPDSSPHSNASVPASAGNSLLRLYAPVAMVIGLGSLAAICLTWYPFSMLVGLLPLPGTLRRRIGRGAIFASATTAATT